MIAGCGYVGKRVANRWLQGGDTVFALTRSISRAAELEEQGIQPIVWDWLVGGPPDDAKRWRGFVDLVRDARMSSLLVAVSHAPQPGVPHDETHVCGLKNLSEILKSGGLLDSERDRLRWIYLSTTGVFGNGGDGQWLDETTPENPERPGSIAAWCAEQWLMANSLPGQFVVLRPSGIYGPDRVPRWESIRDRVPLQVDPQSFLNLIHVDDLSRIIESVSNRTMTSTLYCVSDCEPVRRQAYYEFISKLGGWPDAVFERPVVEANRPNPSRSDGNKRVRNQRILNELSFAFQFPSYREGLVSLLSNCDIPPKITDRRH